MPTILGDTFVIQSKTKPQIRLGTPTGCPFGLQLGKDIIETKWGAALGDGGAESQLPPLHTILFGELGDFLSSRLPQTRGSTPVEDSTPMSCSYGLSSQLAFLVLTGLKQRRVASRILYKSLVQSLMTCCFPIVTMRFDLLVLHI